MSWTQASDPLCAACATTPAIETIIKARRRDLGGFGVGRLLPSARRKLVGPFIFFDQAKRDWKEGRFPRVHGETEFIPLPDA